MCLAASSIKGNDDVGRFFCCWPLLSTSLPLPMSSFTCPSVYVHPCSVCISISSLSLSLCWVKDGLAGVKEKCHVNRFGGGEGGRGGGFGLWGSGFRVCHDAPGDALSSLKGGMRHLG